MPISKIRPQPNSNLLLFSHLKYTLVIHSLKKWILKWVFLLLKYFLHFYRNNNWEHEKIKPDIQIGNNAT